MIDDDGNVVHELRFAHPVERVWAALVDSGALAQWLMPNDFEPVVGHRFRFDGGPEGGFFDVEVAELDPPHRLTWRWMIGGVATTVTITLRADAAAAGPGTVLHLEHRDVPHDPRPNFDRGWVEKFDALALVLKGEL